MRVVVAFLILAAFPLLAQETEPVAVKPVYTPPAVPDTVVQAEPSPDAPRQPGCWRAQPMPRCSGFFLTDIGLEYPVLGTRTPNAGRLRPDFPFRLTWNVGIMGTRGRHSHGGAIGITSDDNEGSPLPFLVEYRYRNWLGGHAALDAGLGYRRNGVRDSLGAVRAAHGVTLMAGFTPNRWIGASVRADMVRRAGRTHSGVLLGVQSTRASEFMFRMVLVTAVRAVLGSIGLEVEEDEDQ